VQRTVHPLRGEQEGRTALDSTLSKPTAMKPKLPRKPAEWLAEITRAWGEARDSIPETEESRHPLTEETLYQLAPLLALRARGRPEEGEEATRVTEVALANVLENADPEDPDAPLAGDAPLAFALGYLATHLALGLIDEDQAEVVLDYCDEHLPDE